VGLTGNGWNDQRQLSVRSIAGAELVEPAIRTV
jgi:hypothetical protein